MPNVRLPDGVEKLMSRSTYYTYFDSPLGPLLLTSDCTSLTGLYMEQHAHGEGVQAEWLLDDEVAPFPEARQQLAAYFVGTLTEFHLPLDPHGTAFQRRVWDELLCIPYGTTMSYGELACRVGNPNASRAVGLANGRNPISIIVPCHRVIGSNGKLTGYGGGLSRKAALLAFEASVLANGPRPFPNALEDAIRDTVDTKPIQAAFLAR